MVSDVRRWYLTPDLVMSWRPCGAWTRDRVEAAFAGRSRMALPTLLGRTDIPGEDRIWVALREDVLSPRILRHFACDCAERALLRERERGREPDPRSWRAVEVARRYADGLATREELTAAWAAARTAARTAAGVAAGAAAWAAARTAARTAAGAAAGAAAWAAGVAAGVAEHEWQCAHLAEMLEAARRSQ